MRRVLAFGLAAVGATLLAGCEQSKSAAPASTVSAAAPAASARALQETEFVASGPLVVENQVDVAAQREGIVAKISAEAGAAVKAGQVLALLDDRQISSDLDAARAKTRSTEADLKNWRAEAEVLHSDYVRAQKMWDAQLITKEQLDHAKYKAESDQWDIKRVEELLVGSRATERSLELELEKTRIRAPFDGLVARRYVRAGQKVAVGDRIFWVTATSPLRVKFTLPERFIATMKKGQELSLMSTGAPELKQKAKVIEISPVVDPSSGTIEVLAEVVNPGKELKPGMSVNVRIDSRP